MSPNRTPPCLETPRLLVRFPALEDVPAIARYVTANREHFRGSGPARDANYYTELYWAKAVADIERDWREDRHCHFFLFGRDDGLPLGRARLSDIVRGALHGCNLGYELDRACQGRGLMTEGLRAVIDYAFGPLNLHRIQAAHRPENLRSARVLQRLGFIQEGLARDYLRVDGVWADHVVTALVNPAWRAPA
ncbi:MAG: GNAT family N-acetyltransferase [Planctomycetes bacterium]|nr:GNAT family N-acetyltransferase [Planctomycetota bacterium]MCL4729249.1 GNAT family N-acetyltransferase [Planctomycetota bacterium]